MGAAPKAFPAKTWAPSLGLAQVQVPTATKPRVDDAAMPDRRPQKTAEELITTKAEYLAKNVKIEALAKAESEAIQRFLDNKERP